MVTLVNKRETGMMSVPVIPDLGGYGHRFRNSMTWAILGYMMS